MRRYQVKTVAGGWPMALKFCWTAKGARKIRDEHKERSMIPTQQFWIEKRIWGHWHHFEA